jgi:phosphoribosylamine--glycine ligase
MKILVVGSAAREHAITRALHLSAGSPELYCYGSTYNPGIAALVKGYWEGDILAVDAVVAQAVEWEIDLAIIGPEAPLEKGLADGLWEKQIPVIGPRKKLAQIETSKAFARDLMQKYAIPGAIKYRVFANVAGAEDFLNELGEGNYVVKADGLMAGKGVRVAGEHLHSIAEALDYCQTIFAQGFPVVIEEKLIGEEFSFMCFVDGETLIPMPLVQDHKRAYVNDTGPNTGGMGSYSAADHLLPFLGQQEMEMAFSINKKVIKALQQETQESYIGILYGSFITTATGVYVIEFNARFGDPESLNVLSLLESDFLELCQSLVEGRAQKVHFANKASVCKYAVPEGYPDSPLRHVVIDVSAVEDKTHLYLAAVHADEGVLYAAGSRAVAYVGIAKSIAEAEVIAEAEINRIDGPLFHREDIGTKASIQRRIETMRKLRSL